MKRDLRRLSDESFDLIVIGGGIIGTGIARDASLRGLHTLLLEKEDFGYGTTSRSSRLIHGGLRYLRTFQFKLVRQDLREREILLQIAPHLVKRLKFLIPLSKNETCYRLTLPFGLCLYDILAIGENVPHWRRLSRRSTIEQEPGLAEVPDLAGSYLYYDCQAESMERLCLENALSAAEKGACILNHALAAELVVRGDRISGVRVQDTLTGEKYTAQGRITINAGGHWADQIWEKAGIKSREKLRRTKGIHLVTRKISENALVLFARSDGRLFFVIPWGNYSLIGTTDTDYDGDPDNVYAGAADVDYLVNETHRYFPRFSPGDIYYTIAGLRPLVAGRNKAASDTSRAHKVIDHEVGTGLKGLITVLGGKITAHRLIAEEAVDLVCRKLGLKAGCITAETPLPGAPPVQAPEIDRAVREYNLSRATVTCLASLYGSRYSTVLACIDKNKRMAGPVGSGPDILAQVQYAVEEEEALTLSDFLLRRSDIGLRSTQGLDVLESVSREMGSLLGWSQAERQKQIKNYRTQSALGQRFLSNLLS